jgi:polysaccharide biosynthesis transport protein
LRVSSVVDPRGFSIIMKELPKPVPSLDSHQNEDLEFRRFWSAILRQRWLFLTVLALTVGGAGLMTYLQTPVYESHATLLIEDNRRGGDFFRGLLPGGLGTMAGLGAAGSKIQTDITILRSREVVDAVVDSLGLHVVLVQPRRPREEVLHVHRSAPVDQRAVYRLQHRGGGSYDLRVESGQRPATLPARVEAGRPFDIGGTWLTVVASEERRLAERIRFEIIPSRTAVRELHRRLKVLQVPGAEVLEIQFRSRDPRMAAAVPNLLASSFEEYKHRIGRAESNSTIDFLQEQANAYAEELRRAERQLQAFRESAEIIEPRAQATEQVRRIAEVQAERDALRAERQSLQRLIARMGGEDPGGGTGSAYRQLASFPTFLINVTIQDVLRTLTELENERSRLVVRRTEQNDEVRAVNERITELELRLYHFAQNYLTELDNRIAALEANLSGYQVQVQRVPSREVELLRLTREQKLLEEVYTLIQTKLKEEQIRAASDVSHVRLMDAALVPREPVLPHPLINLTLATVLGLMLGTGVILIREVRDRRLRTAAETSVALGGAPVLGVIPPPRIAGASHHGRRLALRSALRLLPANTHAQRSLPKTTNGAKGRSVMAEAYRALHTNFSLLDTGGSHQVLVLSDAAEPTGGSFRVALNLAQAFARAGESVLLIDADFSGSGPGYSLPATRSDPGLLEVLRGHLSLEDAVQQVHASDRAAPVFILPHGQEHDTVYPTPAVIESLLAAARTRYSRIILVAPPLSHLGDVALIGRAADAVVVIARLGATDREELANAASQLEQMKVRIAGAVLDNSPLGEPVRG